MTPDTRAHARSHIGAFDARDAALRTAAAQLLVDGFREHWPDAWPTLTAAEAEVSAALEAEKIALAATAPADGALLGWIGAMPQYRGRVWELHPLVVRPDVRGSGIGRALVLRLEEEARKRGGLTLWVGTDDEANLTSLGGADLYPDPLARLARMESGRDHPVGFYRALGFVLAGVVPDANGFGKPDLLLAKRLRPWPARPEEES